MDRYKEIKEKITSKYNSLPKNQKKIADYFVNNFDKIPFVKVQDLSEATGASVASIVRFSQRAGFKGFSELRDSIAGSLQKELHNKEIFPLFEKHKSIYRRIRDFIFTCRNFGIPVNAGWNKLIRITAFSHFV
jgi:DNA-binding MurR/RpiR family transcriptional regulator